MAWRQLLSCRGEPCKRCSAHPSIPALKHLQNEPWGGRGCDGGWCRRPGPGAGGAITHLDPGQSLVWVHHWDNHRQTVLGPRDLRRFGSWKTLSILNSQIQNHWSYGMNGVREGVSPTHPSLPVLPSICLPSNLLTISWHCWSAGQPPARLRVLELTSASLTPALLPLWVLGTRFVDVHDTFSWRHTYTTTVPFGSALKGQIHGERLAYYGYQLRWLLERCVLGGNILLKNNRRGGAGNMEGQLFSGSQALLVAFPRKRRGQLRRAGRQLVPSSWA